MKYRPVVYYPQTENQVVYYPQATYRPQWVQAVLPLMIAAYIGFIMLSEVTRSIKSTLFDQEIK